ncbi:tripartite tricarboxylate transporter substrate binding protein [Bordetella sp. BOR01]|uniref:Bug family tripartite tricarboxylate transporter substrate binding protein n=1 Tax=Bordetella sp. BOR01 TaxID=2854779 RepID=UPI001C44A293|nr:tripartite tricarboxylate transporter substrate binding protein [Bordetella sp. BOR01]MBV7486490.1 tripartite tricarboxylate transporter substrate binding protein [Bordetella sp. BOR01]
MQRRTFCLSAAVALAAPWSHASEAYPNRPVKVVMPYTAGGGGDVVLRPVTAKLSTAFNQPVLIEHKPGAATMIGTEYVARSKPDGYTLCLVTDSHISNPLYHKNIPYDAFADFAPVSQLVSVPLVLVTHPSVPAQSTEELVAYARKNPGKLAYASLGLGGPHYMAMEWFKNVAGIDMLDVPYQGTNQLITAVIGGQVQVAFAGASTALQHARQGRMNALAVSTSHRLPMADHVPTIAEAGYPEYEFMAWHGILAPAGTPSRIVDLLSAEIGLTMRSSEISERLVSIGLIPSPSTPAGFAAKLRRDEALYQRLAGITNATQSE